jgi:hypothetical protein
MNGTKRGPWILFAVFFFLSALGIGAAIAAGPGGPHCGFGHGHFFKLLVRLDLTDSQKTPIAAILKQNEANAKNIVTGLANARVQLARDVLSGSDSAVISADCQNAAQYEVQAAQLTAQLVAQILPTLSADQKTILQEIQGEFGSNIDARIESGFAHLDKWIAKHQ